MRAHGTFQCLNDFCGTPLDLNKFPEDVNTHVVMPRTRAAGGMSYALMKHPNGLECEAPSSHSQWFFAMILTIFR